MTTPRCPKCGGPEWFQGAACLDCGWEIDESHRFYFRLGAEAQGQQMIRMLMEEFDGDRSALREIQNFLMQVPLAIPNQTGSREPLQ